MRRLRSVLACGIILAAFTVGPNFTRWFSPEVEGVLNRGLAALAFLTLMATFRAKWLNLRIFKDGQSVGQVPNLRVAGDIRGAALTNATGYCQEHRPELVKVNGTHAELTGKKLVDVKEFFDFRSMRTIATADVFLGQPIKGGVALQPGLEHRKAISKLLMVVLVLGYMVLPLLIPAAGQLCAMADRLLMALAIGSFITSRLAVAVATTLMADGKMVGFVPTFDINGDNSARGAAITKAAEYCKEALPEYVVCEEKTGAPNLQMASVEVDQPFFDLFALKMRVEVTVRLLTVSEKAKSKIEQALTEVTPVAIKAQVTVMPAEAPKADELMLDDTVFIGQENASKWVAVEVRIEDTAKGGEREVVRGIVQEVCNRVLRDLGLQGTGFFDVSANGRPKKK